MQLKELAKEQTAVRKMLVIIKKEKKYCDWKIEDELAKIAKKRGLTLNAKLHRDLIRWSIGYEDFDDSVYYKDDKDYADGALGGSLEAAKREELNVLGEPLQQCNHIP